MATFRDIIDAIADGENVDAAIANRPLAQLLANTVYLRDLVQGITESEALYRRAVAVESSVAVGQPVYWNSSNSRYELAIADGTEKENVAGLVSSKDGSTICDILLLGFAALDIAAAVDGSVTASRYWLSEDDAGVLVDARPAGYSVLVCTADGEGNVIVTAQIADNIGAQGAQGANGTQGAQGFQGAQGASGAQGFQGYQGLRGFQGATGAGSQGVQGFQGFQGTGGAQGAAGAQGSAGAQGDAGAQGAAGAQGDAGAQGAQGDKLAIVPCWNQFVELVCVEMPEIRFEDIMTVSAIGGQTRVPIDARFLAVCEPHSVQVVSAISDQAVAVGAAVDRDTVVIQLPIDVSCASVTLRLSGVRLGRAGRRFATHSEEDMHKNTRFWSKWTEG